MSKDIRACKKGWPAGLAAGLCMVVAVEAQAADTAVPGDSVLEEVVVTGSRLQSAGFNAPTPVTVVTAETIEQRAPANIIDVINEQPAYRVSQSDTTRNAGGLPQNAQNVLDLRALGGNRTLILINGHRAVGTNWTGTVDTNIVPVGLVERIETVTGGASAAYGSDAVAGVTNIILRNKMQGISGTAQTGMTELSSAKQYTLGISAGTSLFGGRGNIIGGIDYNRSDAIKDAYATQWGRAEIGNISPSVAQRTALGLPQTVIASGVEPGTAAPGGLLYQGTTTGLAYTFDANGNPVPFSQGTLWGTGSVMTGSTGNYGFNGGNVSWLRLPSKRLDMYARGSFDFSERLSAFVELNDSHNDIGPFKNNDSIVGTNTNATTPALTISRTNPFVTPATLALIGTAQTFTIGRINTEWGGTSVEHDIDSRRIVAGLEGQFGKGWKWETYAQAGRTMLNLKRRDFIVTALQKAVNGCDTSVGFSAQNLIDIATYESLTGKSCVPFNPFGVGRTPTAANNYVTNIGGQVDHIEQDAVGASLSGSPLVLPAGDLAVAVGAEYRREQVNANSDPVNQLGTIASANLVEFFGKYEVKEAFAEVGVPLLKDKPYARSLDLNVAGRRTSYQLSGSVTTWKYGFTWEPLDVLRVRFTRSHDIRAPNYFELFLVGGNATGNVINRIPNGVVGRGGSVNVNPPGVNNTVQRPIISVGSGGGRGLVPEIADTTTGGLVFQKGGFHMSADYYQIKIKGAIGGVGAQQEVDFCRDGDTLHCDNIIFDSTVLGGIRLVENKMYNINATYLSGYDVEVGYRHSLLGGNASVRGLVNYAPHNRTFNPLTGLTNENSNTLGNQPKVGYNLSLGYERGRYNANVQVRGFTARRGNGLIYNLDGSLSANTVLGPEDAGYVVTNNNTTSRNRWPAQFTVNPSLNVRLTNKVSVYGNIDNLFDVGPADLSTSNVYDLIGRRYRAGVRATF